MRGAVGSHPDDDAEVGFARPHWKFSIHARAAVLCEKSSMPHKAMTASVIIHDQKIVALVLLACMTRRWCNARDSAHCKEVIP